MKFIRSPRILRRLAFLALVMLMLLLLVPLPHATEGDVFDENLRNLQHVPLFAVVTLLLRYLQLSSQSRWRSLWVCALGAFLLGALSEVAQGFTGRMTSLGDLVADLGGILLVCTVLLRGVGRRVWMMRLLLFLAGGAIFAHTARPWVEGLLATSAMREAFPSLMDLEHSGGLWQAQGATQLQVVELAGAAGGRALEVQMASGSYEGLRYALPKGVDAAGYSGLLMEVNNLGEPFELGIRLDGANGKRQYASVWVVRGRSVLRVQETSSCGDNELVRLVLFTGEDQPARRFRLLKAKLLRGIPRS